jgi:NAD(P)-dependent dehydrogenase (short-subunit alcohol dehydrogenase family)
MGNALEGKVAVVTGGGRGIGRAVSMLLAAEGAKVVVNDYGVAVDGTQPTEGPAAEVAEEIRAAGGTAVPNFDTVASMEGGENLVKTALDNFGRLDAIVCVAGILRDRMIFNLTEEEWDAVIAVHLKGHFTVAKPASILFRQQRSGRIVTFTSGSGLRGSSGQANYGAAKAGIAGFTRVVARDLGRYGVTCNSISPGAQTRMTATVPQSAREIRAARGIGGAAQAAAPPVSAERSPEQVAPMVAYLLTDDAWNINGQIFAVSGGTVSLLYHPTPYRTIFKEGTWTVDELRRVVPAQLMAGVENPAPPPPDLDVPGRPAATAARS